MPLTTLLEFGKQFFAANWTIQGGQGRPMAKGVGTPRRFPIRPRRWSSLGTSAAFPLLTPTLARAVTRFDSITMDHSDTIATLGAVDERGNFVNALDFANSRATPSISGPATWSFWLARSRATFGGSQE